MKLHNASADFFVPDGMDRDAALTRVTHLGVGAHQDDLEFMAFHGIVECFHHPSNQWFGGITCTNGAGSSRSAKYAEFTDEEMCAIRRGEQRTAAVIGRYAAMLQLDYPSSAVKSASDARLTEDLMHIFEAARPQVIYTHNPADKHDTHLGVFAAVLRAVRKLPKEMQPAQVLGCEVWRDLDWLCDNEKIALDVSGHDNLAASLNGVFDSQIAGGKRYDLAIQGRRSANATFFESHATDSASQLCYAMDLTPLMLDASMDPVEFTLNAVDRFRDDVKMRLSARFSSSS